MKPSEEQALIKLLGDDDLRVQEVIEQKLLSLGDEGVSILQQATKSDEASGRRNARRILYQIRRGGADKEFVAFCNLRTQDLEEGAFLLARTAYPDADMAPYRRELDAIATDLRSQFVEADSPQDKVEKINRYLFRQQGFRGNTQDYYDPDNSYLNRVMERRMGIPISLSAVYLFVADRLELPIMGVALPGHFIVKYNDADLEFFIDPFNEGMMLDAKDCQRFVVRSGQEFHQSQLAGVGARQILARMCANLMRIYRERENSDDFSRVSRYLELLAS